MKNGDPEEHGRLIRKAYAERLARNEGVWTDKPICGAATKQDSDRGKKGSPCQLAAGWGTDHYGYGHCRKHGGNTPPGRIKAFREEAMDEIRKVMGPGIEIDPMDALLWCVKLSAGEVAYATWKIEQLEEGEAIQSFEERTEQQGGKEGSYTKVVQSNLSTVHIWIDTRRQSMDRLAKYSKMALDAGIAERQLQLAESAGDSLALGLRKMFDQLALTAEQEEKAPQLVRQFLEELERQTMQPQALLEAG